MLRRRFASVVLAASLAPGLSSAADKAAAPKAPAGKASLPKAAPRGDAKPEELKKVPPFFGMFGTAEMLEKVGFRSRPGSFIEYRIDSEKQGAGDNHGLRLAEVGPAEAGGRWIEMTATDPSMVGQGLRIFTRGEKNGNVERILARIAGMPPMEFPLESMGSDGGASLMNSTAAANGPARMVGHETITVPIGKFETDHWVVDVGRDRRLEYWVTNDQKIPFSGVVKLITENGTGVASKVGSDASATIPVPPRSE